MSNRDDHDRRFLRWLRNRRVIIWISGITILLLCLTVPAYVVVYLYDWFSSTAHGPFSRFMFIVANLIFGLASSFGFILSIWILGQINPERFTTAQELLRHCIDLFDDAYKSNCDVNLLLLFPNPGQFDEYFNLPRRRHKFSELTQKIAACCDNPKVKINLVCLEGTPTDSNSTLHRFLEKFYKSEVELVNPRKLTRLAGKGEYFDEVNDFMNCYLTGKTAQGLSLEYIHKDWLNELEKGEPIMVVGYARNEAFLGTISFIGDKFKFVALDFNGDAATVKTVYDSMKTKYIGPPPTPQQNTST